MNRYLISPMRKGFNFDYAKIGIFNGQSIFIDEDTFQSQIIQDYIKSKFIRYEIREIKPKVEKKTPAKSSLPTKEINQTIDIKQDDKENSGIAESKQASNKDKVDATTKSNSRKKKKVVRKD